MTKTKDRFETREVSGKKVKFDTLRGGPVATVLEKAPEPDAQPKPDADAKEPAKADKADAKEPAKGDK